MSEWFERWFGEEYLDLYPHRDEAEAERLVSLLERHGIGRAGTRILDLACGAGRHAAVLARRGARVVGLDLSAPLLALARRRTGNWLVRGDMRAIGLRSGHFDAIVNLFTSFGYFDDEAQHVAVLHEVARVLAPGGWFVLDFLNAAEVRAHLVPHDERALGRRRVIQERRVSEDGRYVIKSIHVVGEGRSFLERVRLYERDELEALLARAGLAPRSAFGDYDGGAHVPGAPRCLLLAQRT